MIRSNLRWIGPGLATFLLLAAGNALALGPAEVQRFVHQVEAQIEAMQESPESAQYGAFYCAKLTVNPHQRPWPAVGIYQMDYTFYFDRDVGDVGQREPKPYPDRLVKADCVRRVSARTIRQQYWYWDSQPVLRRSEEEGRQTDLLLLDSHSAAVRDAQREAGEILRTFRTVLAAP